MGAHGVPAQGLERLSHLDSGGLMCGGDADSTGRTYSQNTDDEGVSLCEGLPFGDRGLGGVVSEGVGHPRCVDKGLEQLAIFEACVHE